MDPRQTQSISTPAEDEELLAAFETCVLVSVPLVLTSAVELGIIDLLAREGGASARLSPSQIVSRLGITNPDAPRTVDRMLRLLASFSYLSCTLDGDQRLYGIGPKSKYFVSSEAGSFAPLLRFLQHKTVINGWYGLQEAVKNGGSPFQNANAMSIFDCAMKDPAFSALLNNGMKAPTPLYMNKILDSYRGFEGAKTVADVGGGVGESLRLILNKFPHLRGINYDLPHVVKDAPAHPRMEHVGGDLSKSIPKADILFMKWLFHGRPDDFCKKLLKNCYEALPPNGKVVIFDPILPDYPETDAVSRNAFTSDMIMLGASPGGVDRTRKELEALALSAGFDKPRIPCRAYNMWVMELHKRK
ncbi:caffeic acid 3-O-methyltransferase-like [Rhodamnia argentea]|uniref:Caffeic acid 3-O-methyltransferase-like n=1 Tax=Rhodamnia argentea TaxID=178133 RepID=A0A8B8NE88_9MYRT|nr:caffeic acid 3-O-methyltransferase-like [Rhodamnia argentea]